MQTARHSALALPKTLLAGYTARYRPSVCLVARLIPQSVVPCQFSGPVRVKTDFPARQPCTDASARSWRAHQGGLHLPSSASERWSRSAQIVAAVVRLSAGAPPPVVSLAFGSRRSPPRYHPVVHAPFRPDTPAVPPACGRHPVQADSRTVH